MVLSLVALSADILVWVGLLGSQRARDRKQKLLFGNRSVTYLPLLDRELERRTLGATKMQRRTQKALIWGMRKFVYTKAFEHVVLMKIQESKS